MPLKVVQLAELKAPLLVAEAVGILRVITGVVVLVTTLDDTSVPVVPKVKAATSVTVPEPEPPLILTVTSFPTVVAVTAEPTKFNEAGVEVKVVPSSLIAIAVTISLNKAIVPVVFGSVQVFAVPVVVAEIKLPPRPRLNPNPLLPINLFAVISFNPAFQFAVSGVVPSSLTKAPDELSNPLI